MNYTALRYFVAVAKAGSIREGADSLRIAQSAISRQIMALEEEFGVKLLERQPRGIGLTAAGEMFLRFARDGLSQMARMRGELNELKKIRSGVVRVASVEPFAHRLLPQCVSAFLDRYPGVGTDIRVAGGDGVVDAITNGEASIGIDIDAEDDKARDETRILLALPDPLVAFVQRGHPLSAAKTPSVGELAAFDLALPSTASRARQTLDRAASAAGVALRPLVESDSTQLLLNMAGGSDAVAVLSRLVAAQWQDSRDLVAVPLRDKQLKRVRITVFTSRLRQLPPAAEAFADMLQLQMQAAQTA